MLIVPKKDKGGAVLLDLMAARLGVHFYRFSLVQTLQDRDVAMANKFTIGKWVCCLRSVSVQHLCHYAQCVSAQS